MKYLEVIVRNLCRRIGRTILVVLAIAIAAVVFAILVAVPDSMDRIINSGAAGQHLYIVNRAGPAPTYGVPGKYCHDVRLLPHVAACAAEWDFLMTYRSPSDWINLTPSDIEILDLAPDYHGSPEEYAHYRREKRAAALGSEILRKYGWRVGQTIMLHDPNGQDFAFVIVSVLPSQYYPNAFLVRRDYMEDTYKSRGGIGYAARLVVRVDSADNLGIVARTIDEKYRNSEADQVWPGLTVPRGHDFGQCAGKPASHRTGRLWILIPRIASSVAPNRTRGLGQDRVLLYTQSARDHRRTQPCLGFGFDLKESTNFETLFVGASPYQQRGGHSFYAHLALVEVLQWFIK